MNKFTFPSKLVFKKIFNKHFHPNREFLLGMQVPKKTDYETLDVDWMEREI